MGCNCKKKSKITQMVEAVQEKVDEFTANNELFTQRINICEKCDYFSRATLAPRCLECGCFLDAKARLKDSECPIGKW